LSRRVYFYKDKNGAIKKFSYCCICSAGPFKQSDKNIEFITTGGKSEVSYCIKCFKNLGMKSEDIIKPSSVNNEDVEIVEFKKQKPILESPVEEILQKDNSDDIQEVRPQEEIIEDITLRDPEPVDEMVEELEPIEDAIEDPLPIVQNTPCEAAEEINELTSNIEITPEIVEEDRKGEYYVYLGQYMDGSYRVDVAKDVIREIEDINAGNDPLLTKLPIELIYYNKMNSWKEAQFEKDQILLMNNFQKEELSKDFIKKIFEDVHI
jgi:hypothetical protein